MFESQSFLVLHADVTARLMPMVLPFEDTTGADILQAVSDEFAVPISDIKGNRRQAGLVAARHMVMLLARQYARHLSYPQIAAMLRRDHSTIMYGANKAAERVASDEWYAAKRRRILARLAYEQ